LRKPILLGKPTSKRGRRTILAPAAKRRQSLGQDASPGKAKLRRTESASADGASLVTPKVLISLFATSLLLAHSQVPQQHQAPPSPQTVAQLANNLLTQMTPEEKIGQLSQVFLFGPSPDFEQRIRKGELGSVLFITDPAFINRMQHVA